MIKLFLSVLLLCSAVIAGIDSAEKSFQAGNYKDALIEYRAVISAGQESPAYVKDLFSHVLTCMQKLGHFEDWDDFSASALRKYNYDWRIVLAISSCYKKVAHYGALADGKFIRGGRVHGGEWCNVQQRDRSYCLKMLAEAVSKMEKDATATQSEKQQFYMAMQQWLYDGAPQFSWKLQKLTDLSKEPDWKQDIEDDNDFSAAPVDANGNPVFYEMADSWNGAKNDGEWWRWCLKQLEKNGMQDEAIIRYADFLNGQFGVNTIFGSINDSKSFGMVTMLENLKEDESIAHLANGIRKIRLPDEHNCIKLYKSISDKSGRYAECSLKLGNIFAERRQYETAASYYRHAGKAGDARLKAIVSDWCDLQEKRELIAGEKCQITLRYRNADSVVLRGWRVNAEELKEHFCWRVLSGERGRFNFDEPLSMVMLDEKGKELAEKQWRFLEGDAIEWKVKLSPKKGHHDTYSEVELPFSKAGIYLVESRAGESVSRRCYVIGGAMILSKQLNGEYHWQLLKSKDGMPLPGKILNILAWNSRWDYKTKKNIIQHKQFKQTTDKDGNLFLDAKLLQERSDWQFFVEADCGGELGWAFFNSWQNVADRRLDDDGVFKHMRQYAVTDRPVYHPGDTVHFKMWMTNAEYSEKSANALANGHDVTFVLNGPDYDELLKLKLKTDAYGAVETSWKIPEDAKLGRYSFGQHYGSYGFLVEEYRKPEYEVKVEVPEEPIALGEATRIRIKANYYFGMPVSEADVSVKIERNRHYGEWWPVMPWEWFYGKGYGWLWENCAWYPGWQQWGIPAPLPTWIHHQVSMPELICNVKGHLLKDGTFEVPLDTAIAKMMMPEWDQAYSITAEVRDKSRRTIVGKAEIIAARKPFDVKVMLDRGFYSPGERMAVKCFARTPNGKPAGEKARLSLIRVTYDKEGKPSEKVVYNEDKALKEGEAAFDIAVKEAGQYRISCKVTDARRHTEEGALLVPVYGKGAVDSGAYRWNELELIPDKAEYAPGEKVRLAVNTAQKESSVMLFARAENGCCSRPVVLHLINGSLIYETDILPSDMPNIFFEAYTVSEGRVHNVVREIFVPPAKRILNVEVLPAKADVEPGSRNSVDIRITDDTGKGVQGSIALCIYDRSVDAVAQRERQDDIKSAFWKWRRYHNPHVGAKQWHCPQRLLNGEKPMPPLSHAERLLSRLDEESFLQADVFGNADRANGMNALRMAKAAAPMLMATGAANEAVSDGVAMANGASGSSGGDEISIRSNFADTALWRGTLETDVNGCASVEVPMPDSLTEWKVQAWAITSNSAVGSGEAVILTSKELMVRLESPRFLVEQDEVVVSALVNSKREQASDVVVTLDVQGDSVQLISGKEQRVKVAFGSDARVDWHLRTVGAGKVIMRVKAKLCDTPSIGDGMEVSIPVFVHGAEKQLSFIAMMKEQDGFWKCEFEVPEQIEKNSASLTVNWSPSLALAMVDALPYLISFEYDSSEQTLNRFLPAVAVRRCLQKMGISLQEIARHSANLNPQQLNRGAQRKRQDNGRLNETAVFDDAELNAVILKNMRHLLEMQCEDGGWGWFCGYGEHSWPHTTVQVVKGLLLAKEYGLQVDEDSLRRGIEWLKSYQQRQLTVLKKKENYKQRADVMDAFVNAVLLKGGVKSPEMVELLWRDKNELPVMGKIFLAEILLQLKDSRLDAIMENIRQYAVYDDENMTAYLDTGDCWWCWYADENEAMALWLSLLVRSGKDKETPPRLVKYLLNNRKYGCRWRSTRDTAACLEAFTEYALAAGEAVPDMKVQVVLDGRHIAQEQINKDNLFDGKLSVSVEQLQPGRHSLSIAKAGNGRLYANAYIRYFSRESMIKASGLELKVRRNVYRIKSREKIGAGVTGSGNTTAKKVLLEERELLREGEQILSGELLEIELLIDSKNDYEYILLEEKFAAGTEPLAQHSGYDWESGAYMEYRIGKVAMFFRGIPRGRSIVKYRLRVENPGSYSALPTTITGVYAPELYGNADEMKICVQESSK